MTEGKKLLSLKEYNEGAMRIYREKINPSLNGIACPQCGKELVDSDPHKVLLSNPPKTVVKCNDCEFNGYRFT